MIPNEKPKTRPVRIQHNGRVLYFRRLPEPEARKLEAEKRDELARTGRVTGARSMRRASNYVAPGDSWMLDLASSDTTGEQRVMLAVLEDALGVLRGGSATPRERVEAECWFASDDRSHLYAFATICEAFNVDPDFVRRKLFRRQGG